MSRQGPLTSATLTPGPDSVEKVVWSRRPNKGDKSRLFDLPCSGAKLTSRNGLRDTQPPYTCGSFARRAVIKYYLRNKFGGMKDSDAARQIVVEVVKKMINRTRDAWELDANYYCTCKNGSSVGWECCSEQNQCATEPCTCPAGYEVTASVACCRNVCGGLAGNGLMEAFSYINGSDIAVDLLEGMGGFMQNDIWTFNDPWLLHDPSGDTAYKNSWEASKFEVIDAGLFDTAKPIVTYEEYNYPFKNTMWKHCAGLLQQVVWTMPVDSTTGKPRIPSTMYDPMSKSSNTINITYTEEFIQSITLQAYKSSPVFWHYNTRYVPSDSEFCKRSAPRVPVSNTFFDVGNKKAPKFGYSSMTIGGVGGADCYCGWWSGTAGDCKIPSDLCDALVQIVGFLRVCIDQNQVYNSSDHTAVLQALETLQERQPRITYPCPALQISEHWGFMETATGLPLANATKEILTEGVSGFRKGNTDWLFEIQSSIVNYRTRKEQLETSKKDAALKCNVEADPRIADHFIDDLFPAAQGVRQSTPQTYCTRYGIELARLTVYKAAGLSASIGQQQAVVDKWRVRCQYKLEELAVCNLHRITKAYNASSHRSTAHCPFSVTATTTNGNTPLYSVTPGCLLVVWNTALEGIFDPCICLASTNSRSCAGSWVGTYYSIPVFDIPGDTQPACMLQGLQDLVGETVIPGETEAGVPIGSGSFEALMSKDQRNFRINTHETNHWTLHKEIRDADYLQDWWPDEWKFPAGYHVTPGCSRNPDYHWKTFDSSWRWHPELKEMILSKDETNDALLRRNAFGASGVCRSNNYGMPMTGLNTMTTCTMENANAKADPMVPSSPEQATQWSDGTEYCAPDSSSTPWAINTDTNPPRQWTVGTLQQEIDGLLPLDVTEWGPGCGPYPIRTCRVDVECATGLKCLRSSGATVGVCAKTAAGVFECTEHSHCQGDQMCAGDGKCVNGYWKVTNSLLQQNISFRTHSQLCSTGIATSTWGTSVAENVPDILRSSGLCSFRSWYENRKMAEANQCVQGSCSNFKGVYPWNFSDRVSQNAAFDDGVLKVKAHPCDREYQFYEGFVACTPNDAMMGIFDAFGQRGKERPRLDSRTRTYRLDKTLPLMSLTRGDKTRGFTGIPRTYVELGLGTNDPMIKPCSKVRICGLQPGFKVNGKLVGVRMVLDSGVAREYSVMDMIKCGSFGFIRTGVTAFVQCILDYSVVPLAYVYKNHRNALLPTSQTLSFILKEGYITSELDNVFNELKLLPSIFIDKYIGPTPETLAKYMDGTEKFTILHDKINEVSKPFYEGAGTPKQIYYITKRGVYEVPFVWWFRCIWLGGMSMAEYEIESAICPLVPISGVRPSPEIVFPPHDSRLQTLVNEMPSTASGKINNGTLLSILKQLPGVISRSTLNKVSQQYKEMRSYWLEKIKQTLGKIIKKCYGKKMYVNEYSAKSEEYQLQWMDSYQIGPPYDFDITKTYVDINNQTVCSGKDCLRSEFPGIATLSKATDFGDVVASYFNSTNVQVDLAVQLGSVAQYSDDWYVYILDMVKSESVDSSKWSELLELYPSIPNGCINRIFSSKPHNEGESCVCKVWGECSSTLQNRILSKSNIPRPVDNQFATLKLEGMGETAVCSDVFEGSTAPKEDCYVDSNELISGSNYSLLTKLQVPVGLSLDAYQQTAWECARFTCVNPQNQFHNKITSIENRFPLSRTVEQVTMTEVIYYQKMFFSKTRPWENMIEEVSEMATYGTETYCMPPHEINVGLIKITVPYQNMPLREVEEGIEFKLKVYTFNYSINGTKVADIETYPCADDADTDKPETNIDIIFNNGFPIPIINTSNKQSVLWPRAVQRMKNYNPYRSNQMQKTARMCNLGGPGGLVPNAETIFDMAEPRNIVWNLAAAEKYNIKSPDELKTRVKKVIVDLHAKMTEGADDCLTYGCQFTDETTQGSAKIRDTYSSDHSSMQDFCTRQKNDPVYGCRMFPGEAVTKEDKCERYPALAPLACVLSKDPFPCTWSQLKRCLIDSSDNKCYNDYERDSGNFARKYRNMRPEGRIIDYTMKTFVPECTAGPSMKCKLSAEYPTILANNPSKKQGFCPSMNGTASRSRLYNQMKNTLNTGIDYLFTLPDESGSTEANLDTGYIDHIHLALDPRYSCSATSPTCPLNNQIPIEVRSRLWRCAQCPLVSNTYCTGQHDCKMESPGIPRDSLYNMIGWDFLTAQEQAFLISGTNGSIADAVSSTRWLVSQAMNLAIRSVGLAYTVPDFMRTYSEPDFAYSPLSILAYSSAMEDRVGSCETEGIIKDFTNCSYDINRRRLRDFINSTTTGYKVADGVIIPSQSTLVWQISRSQMMSQNIPSWVGTDSKAGMFWRDLFDDKWCKSGNMQDNACYISSASSKIVVEVLNPGLLGDFEPLVGCDTKIINGQRVINSMCPICPTPKTESEALDILVTESTPMPCPSYYKATTGVTNNLEASSNLCGKEPAYESSCTNLQGMLGHTTYDGNQVQNLYSRVAWRGGLPPGLNENPLFRPGGKATGEVVSNLILKMTDIGGHCVSIEIKNTSTGVPSMLVVGLPLSSYVNMEDANSRRDETRLGWMQINVARELDRIATLYPNSVCATWDCPLRRRAFYAGRVPGRNSPFRPLIPDPLRTHVLYGTRVHPTQNATLLTENLNPNTRTLGVYYTVNGFCACMVLPCSCPSDEGALTGTWQTATAAASGCSNQIDWPYPGGTLRDNSIYASNLGSTMCGILDRLPQFKYRYVNTKRIIQSTKTTLDKGGVCHMGWPVVLGNPIPTGCHIPPESNYYVCPKSANKRNDFSRLRARTLTELLNYRLRPTVKQCEPPPKYRTSDGTGVKQEVSYGTLRRLETSRMLAIDLRRRLCGNSSVCAPSAAWELSSFWNDVYMKDFPSPPSGDGANQTLWDQPWAACVQHKENQTQTCEGKINRETWIRGNRTRVCLDTIKNTSIADQLAQPINVCDLDQDMDFFCRSIQDARYKVFEANCLYSGQCRQKLFFYQPSTYSVDNAQFVRSTVQQFYDSSVKGACVPDLDTAAAIRANADNLKNCAALTLTTLADCLQIVRVIMDALVEIAFYVGNLWLYIFQMLAVNDRPELRSQIIQQINAIILHIKNSFLQLFNAFGDLVYKILFDGPMGKWLMTAIIRICELLNWLNNNVVQPIICWVRGAVLFVLDPIGMGFVNVINKIAFGQLGYLNDNINNAKKSVRETLTCNNRDPLSCNITFRSDPPLTTALPLATRCWAGAEPGINSFACTAADTCLNNDFSKVICGACPASSSMIQFGCNTLTKLCSCNIFPKDTTFCSSHEECTMDNNEVECEFVDSYLEPSYGHIPCTQCPKPICLISDGSGVGKCSCLLRPIPNQGCAGLGERVSPSASSLCLVSTAGGGQGSSSTYTQTYRTLASVPCMLINQAASYCMQVYTSATSSMPLVVGTALLRTFTGRRLLQFENGSVTLLPTTQLVPNTSVWEGTGEPCRSLVAANTTTMGILEKYTLSECWRWRDVGVRLIAETNMTNVNPTFLVSWQDLLSTMLSEGAVPEIIGKLPQVIHSLLLHTEAAQPVYVTLLYWSSYLPKEAWSNQTILDKAKEYLMNFTHRHGEDTAGEGLEPGSRGRRLLTDSADRAQLAGVQSEWRDGPYGWLSNQIYWNLPAGGAAPRRRLFTAEEPIAQSASTVNTVPSAETVYQWSQGPYTWPPNFNYWKGKDSCAVVSTAVKVVKNGLDVTVKYYQSTVPEPKKVVWPSMPLNENLSLNFSIPNTTELGDIMLQYTDQLLNKTIVEDFLDAAPYAATLKSLIQCNFTRIQTCNDRYDLFWSTILVVVILLITGFVGRLLEIPYIEGVLLLFFVPLVMYAAYGYALTCAPLVPVCALRDLLSLLDMLLPEAIVWPNALVTTPQCRDVSCMRPCTGESDIGFDSWRDHLAWVMCETDANWCRRVAVSLAPDDPLRKALRLKYDQGEDPDSTRAARRICFVVTLANSAPSFLTVLLLLSLVPSVLGFCVSGAQFASNTLFSFLIYVHGNREE